MDPAFAARYAGFVRDHWWFRARRRILETLIERECPRGAPRILAVGAGPPEGVDWLARFGAVTAVEIDAVDHPAYVRARAEALPFDRATFDLICAFDVIEHLDDDAAALAEMRRVARSGARIAVTVPALPSLWSEHDVMNHHRRRYTRASLASAFELARVSPSWIGYFNSLLYPAVAIARRVSPARPGTSDFDRPSRAGFLLERILASERHLLGRVPFPAGVSLAAVARL